jgi:anti-sigma regulatory factor (Ser/Thr protein kinase)
VSLAETTYADRLSLEIPLDAAHILTARLFAGGVARSLELGEETADVLRVTLTEICSEAIERRREGRIVIDVSADMDPTRVTVVATGVLGDETPTNPTEATYRRTLIEALVPDATFIEERDRLTVMFTL